MIRRMSVCGVGGDGLLVDQVDGRTVNDREHLLGLLLREGRDRTPRPAAGMATFSRPPRAEAAKRDGRAPA
jgi:hypothetical protein